MSSLVHHARSSKLYLEFVVSHKGGPIPFPKIISVSGANNGPKNWPFAPSCLNHDNLALSIMLMQAWNRGEGLKVLEMQQTPKNTGLEAGLHTSLELQCRKTMEIRTKTCQTRLRGRP